MLKNLSFTKNVLRFLIVPAVILVLAVVMIFVRGVNLDIDFTGGYISSYSYTGDLDVEAAQKLIADTVNLNVTVTKSSDISGSRSKIDVSIAAKDGITAEQQKDITDALVEKFADNNISLNEVKNVSANIGGKFFAKSIVAVIIAALLVIIYVAIRFKNIGGASAAVSSLIALVHDVLIAFSSCVILGIKIDTNFMAVVLTLFGYSLNNTIVIYDRVRENRRKAPDADRAEIVDMSIHQTMLRSILTTVTTLFAVVAIAVISELRDVTSLRSLVIPLAVGLVAGFYSSVAIAGPLWVKWRAYTDKVKANKKSKKPAKKKK